MSYSPITNTYFLRIYKVYSCKKVYIEPGMVVHTFNASIWEAGAGRYLCVWGQPGLNNKFSTSQGYTVRTCLKKQNINKKQVVSYPAVNSENCNTDLPDRISTLVKQTWPLCLKTTAFSLDLRPTPQGLHTLCNKLPSKPTAGEVLFRGKLPAVVVLLSVTKACLLFF